MAEGQGGSLLGSSSAKGRGGLLLGSSSAEVYGVLLLGLVIEGRKLACYMHHKYIQFIVKQKRKKKIEVSGLQLRYNKIYNIFMKGLKRF